MGNRDSNKPGTGPSPPRRTTTDLLQDDSELFRALSRASFEAIFLSEKGICLAQNQRAEEMFGYTSEEAVGRPGTDWIAHSDREMVMQNMVAGFEQPYEARALRKDGSTFPCEIQGKMMRYRGRGIRVTALIDITERKQIEQQRLDLVRQVQAAQKLESLGVLAGGIAHDFNNLLMVILGNTDLALDGLSPQSELKPMLHEIESATRQAADLTRQMLAYSGMGHFVVGPVDLNRLVSGIGQLLASAVSGDVQLSLNLADTVPEVSADRAQLQQVVLNLVTNAAEAYAEGERGRITLKTGAGTFSRDELAGGVGAEAVDGGRFVWLEVTDDGCGMDRGTRERMFDPFFSNKFTGRGLGMAATLGIVRGHRGVILVCSELGRGTTIRILIPVAGAGEEEVAAHRSAEPAWTGSGTVLLVDDDRGVLNVARSMIERCGFRVITAEDGLQAVEIFREHAEEITCVILDLTMKRMGGEEAYAELLKRQPDVRVVISSGYAEQELRERFAGRHLAGFIQKPYRMADLRRLLREINGQPGPPLGLA
jgi:two-component system cell cycle sensor histidine kinase/response regulator CckA